MVPSLVSLCVTTITTELMWLQQQEQQCALGEAGAKAAGALGAAGASVAFGAARTAGQARRRWLWELSRILAPEVQLLLLARLSSSCLLTSDALRALFGPHCSARGATRTLDLNGNMLLDASAVVSTITCFPEPAPSMAAFDGLTSLTSLNLSKIESLRDADIAAIACSSGCRLKSLQLSACVQITSLSIHAISKECRQLQLLDVSECWQVAEILPLNTCRGLRSLELHGCWAIPPDQVSAVLHVTCHSLKHLGLARCCQMDHRAFASVWTDLPASLTEGRQGMSHSTPPQHQHRLPHFCGLSLTSLDVSGTQVNSTTLALLALLAPRLTRLSLTSCPRISGLSVLNFVHLRGLALQWAECKGVYNGAAGTPDAAQHTVGTFRTHREDPGASGNPDGAGAQRAPPPPVGSCAAALEACKALPCLQPPISLESLSLGGMAWTSTTGHTHRSAGAPAAVTAEAGAAMLAAAPPPPPRQPTPATTTVEIATAAAAAAAAAAGAAGAAVPSPPPLPPPATATAGPPGVAPAPAAQASHQVSLGAPSAAEARTPPPPISISSPLPSSPPSLATLLHAACLCCAAYTQFHLLAQARSTATGAAGAPRTHMPSVPAPVPPSPPHLADLLPELTKDLSAAAAAATAAAAQADGEGEGRGEAHGGGALGAGGWAGEEGDLSEDDGAAIVQALLAPPSVPSPLRLTHLDVSGARGTVGSWEVRVLADCHAHTLQSLNLQGCAAASMVTSGGYGAATDHEEEDVEGCLFGLARLSLLTSLNLGGSEGVSAEQRRGTGGRLEGGWGSLAGHGGGGFKHTRVSGSGFWRPSPAGSTRSDGNNSGVSQPSHWQSSRGDGSSVSSSSSSLFQLQQQQQQWHLQYNSKRSREEGYAGGGVAKEEGLAQVMRTLCEGNGPTAGEEMRGGLAAVNGGRVGVGDKNGPYSGAKSSNSSSGGAFECPEEGCLGVSSRQTGSRTGGRLRSLCLSHTFIGDTCLSALQGLTSLDITGCKRVNDTGVLQVLLRCRQLQVLKLSSIPALTPSALGGPMTSSAILPDSAPGAAIPASSLPAAAQTPSALGGPMTSSVMLPGSVPGAAIPTSSLPAAAQTPSALGGPMKSSAMVLGSATGAAMSASSLPAAAQTPSTLGGPLPMSPSAAAVQPTAAVGPPGATAAAEETRKEPAAAVGPPGAAATTATAATAAAGAGQQKPAASLQFAAAHSPIAAPCSPSAAAAHVDATHSTMPTARGPLLRLPSAKASSSPSLCAARIGQGRAGPRGGVIMGRPRKLPATYAPPPSAPPPPPYVSEDEHVPLGVSSLPAAAPETQPPSGAHAHAQTPPAYNPTPHAHGPPPQAHTAPPQAPFTDLPESRWATPARLDSSTHPASATPATPTLSASAADVHTIHSTFAAPVSATHPASATLASTTRAAPDPTFCATHSAPAAPFSGRGPCLSAISLPRGTASPACVTWLTGGLIPRHTLPQAQVCTQLQKVEIVGARGVDDESLVALTQSCPCLRQITLKGADHVSDAGALSALSCCPALRRFTLTGSPRVSDATLSLALSHSRRPTAAQSSEGLGPLAAQSYEGLRPLAAQSYERLRPLAAQSSEVLIPGTATTHTLQSNKKRQRGEEGQAGPGPSAGAQGDWIRDAGFGRTGSMVLGPGAEYDDFGLRVGVEEGRCQGASKARRTPDAGVGADAPRDDDFSDMREDIDSSAHASVEAADVGIVHAPPMAGSLTHLDLSGCLNITGKPFMDLLQLPPLPTCPLHHPLHGKQAPSILQPSASQHQQEQGPLYHPPHGKQAPSILQPSASQHQQELGPLYYPPHGQQTPSISQHSASQQQQGQRQHAPQQCAAQQQGDTPLLSTELQQQQQAQGSIPTQAQAHQPHCSCPPSLYDLIHAAASLTHGSAQQHAISPSCNVLPSLSFYLISSAPPLHQQQQASHLSPSQQAQHAQHLASMHSMVAGMRTSLSPAQAPALHMLCSAPHTPLPSSPPAHTSSLSTAPQLLHLRTLRLNQCKRVSESAVVAACVACPHLSSLSVHGVSGVTQASLEVMSATSPNIKEIEAGGTSVTSVPPSLLFPSSPLRLLVAPPSSPGHGFTSDSLLASGFPTGQGPACSQPHTLAATHGSNDARMDEECAGMPLSPFVALSSLQLPFALRARLTTSGLAAACTQHRPWLRLSFSG